MASASRSRCCTSPSPGTGTGKTTSAQLYAEALRAGGALPRGQLVKASRKDLVAGYVGQSEARVAAALEAARGGVLFIDEAYALEREGADFGGEVLPPWWRGWRPTARK